MMDLPNEMIYTIWNKLDRIDVLYSFMGVNKRFNELVCNMVYTRSIDLIQPNNYNGNSSLTYPILDRFCLHILPQIHELVECLTLESISMERILSAGHYPHLQKLTIVNIKPEFVIQYFIGIKICVMFQLINSVNLFRRIIFCSYFQTTNHSFKTIN